ncbi:MAG: isocitrate/isopropylmalate family dehydrogenase [Gemmataceae bacterium]|nr:isocitrate/isopropylmalate family dehydrogenase [Gemmataceae bacterium]
MLRVPLIHGGGIGHDIVPAVKGIIAAAGVAIAWDEHLAGGEAAAQGHEPLPRAMLDAVRQAGLALKTKLQLAPRDARVNYNILLRRELDLFASVRPLKNLQGLPARFQNVDMLVVRELTEDLYASIEHEIVPGVVQSIKVVTETASRRFFRFAFDWARAHGRRSVHCVHKANILKLADGLFLEAFRGVAKDYPDLQPKEIIVDNCCMQMVSRPQQFDVLAMGNLYGDIVSDLGAGLVGGISATHGINVGAGVKIFESFHGGSRESIGVNRANPLPLLLPAIDLLNALGHQAAAERIHGAVERVLSQGRVRSRDLGGDATTTEFAEAISAAL